MFNHSNHTNKWKPVTVIKMSVITFLICGFVYSCNNAKGKKVDNGNNALTHQRDNNQSNQIAEQKSHNTQMNQVSKQTGSQAQSPKEKKKKITKNWKTFFYGKTGVETRIHLLQNGKKFKKVLKSFSQSKMAQQASATITGIKLNNDTTATVSYTINIGGAPVLKDKTGKAFYLNGMWKVGDAAFCSLIELSGNTPEPCQGVGQ